ncbi:hypothetical protein D9615_009228 [Tricholomella constricta]|uniref:F-box domain-containing protein n=1 Tax=Tricholomella constricta TaxID=117010 RepID=A0A8H5GWW5_9AGAR|nr:hypothetical protein D9615_009228 [Tricholomella constricta]
MPLQGDDDGLNNISNTLLHTNHRCDSAQVRSVNAMIVQRSDNIKAIDHNVWSIQLKINELMNSIKALKEARLQEKKEISCCEYILSPIRLLPHELLMKIFKYTVTVCHPSRSSKSPLALTHVCSTWRNVLSGSDFWNELELFVMPSTKASPGVFSERVASWYGHSSSSHPLRLSVWIGGTPKDFDVQADLSQSIAAFSPRFVKLSLNFEFGNYDALAPFLCLPSDSLPALESLCLLAGTNEEAVEPGDTPPLLPPTAVFAAAPRLHTLYLSVPSRLLTDLTRLCLPWTQLTHLIIANAITLSAFTHVLFQCAPRLRSARFACISIAADHSDPAPRPPRLPSVPQTFPCLEHLSLSVLFCATRPGTPSILNVLQLLRLPNLQTIKVSSEYDTFPAYALLHHLAEPGSTAYGRAFSLKEIVLCHVKMEAAELVEILGRFTGVEKLGLFVRSASPNVILRRMKEMGWLLHLREFSFVFLPEDAEGKDMRGVGKDFGALVAEWTKCGGGRRLQKAGLYAFGDLGQEVVRAMAEDVRAAALFGDAEYGTSVLGDDRVRAHAVREPRLDLEVEMKHYFDDVTTMFGFSDEELY